MMILAHGRRYRDDELDQAEQREWRGGNWITSAAGEDEAASGTVCRSLVAITAGYHRDGWGEECQPSLLKCLLLKVVFLHAE